MTYTVGYWCDECRRKYVQHVCHEGLPCGHDMRESVKVLAQNYRGGKHGTPSDAVRLYWLGGILDLWVSKNPDKMATGYFVSRVVTLEEEDAGTLTEGVFLRGLPPKIRRAYLERWTSNKTPPDWVLVDQYIEVETQ